MSKTLVIASTSAGRASVANTTQYWKVANWNFSTTTETSAQNLFRNAGVLSGLIVKLSANAVAATSTFTLRKNAGDITQTVAPGSTATGDFEDTTHTDTIAAGDKIW